ncbi:putative N2,N2-dimethylguanosine tRNA methyltransferase [Handroanthus impetiginosus]|uniref:Putative N2,N2-dimethylguanosine tRNA methyltransferase n=1 Tax=Handroanthus impetiginosus TaxID=429701 RepID=A0A2G9HG10_9LAMI|nr:putative N2,N2-dimethylguanosine tRNA methyltransferase [Handroanthus impetiginosus]
MRRLSTPLSPFTMSQPMPLEETIQENHEENHAENQETYHLQSINSTILIRQLPSEGLSFQLWPAANTLVTLLDHHRHHDTNPLSSFLNTNHRLRLLELGSGTGLVGIAAAALFGASVTVTDLPHVLPNLQFNVDANAGILELHGGAVNVAALSWGDVQHMEALGREYDVILGSDVVYHDHLYEPLLQTLRFFLLGSEKEVVFLMAHLKRWKKESAFFKKAKKVFHVEVMHTDTPCNGSRVGVAVYKFVRKGGEKLNSMLSQSKLM